MLEDALMKTTRWLEQPRALALLTLAFALVPVGFAFTTFRAARERDAKLFQTATDVLGEQLNLSTFKHLSFLNMLRNQWRYAMDSAQPPRTPRPPAGWNERFPHLLSVAFISHVSEQYLPVRWIEARTPRARLSDNLANHALIAEGMKRARLTSAPIAISVRLSDEELAVIEAVTDTTDSSLVRGYLVAWLDLRSICEDATLPLIRTLALKARALPENAATSAGEVIVSTGEGEVLWKAVIARGQMFSREYGTPTPWLGFAGFALSALPLSLLVMLATRAGKLRSALEAEREVVRLKTHFLHSVSHEFRTPLSVIQSGAELIEHYTDQLTPERRAQALTQIKNSTQLMNEMVEQVLTLGRLEAGAVKLNLVPVNVGDLCRSIAEEVRIATQDRCPMEVNVAIEGCIELDAGLVRTMLINALTNAVKYSNAGEKILFHPLLSDGVVRFSVVDQGIGIVAQDQARLGQPFFRGQNVADIPGTGLGLTILDRCAQLHGAEYGIHSRDGAGTQVVIVIRGRTSELRMMEGRPLESTTPVP